MREEKKLHIEDESPQLDWLKAELAKLDELELPEDFEEGLEAKLSHYEEEKKTPVFGMINEDEKIKMAKTIAYLLIPLAAAFVLIVALSMNSLNMELGKRSMGLNGVEDAYQTEDKMAMDEAPEGAAPSDRGGGGSATEEAKAEERIDAEDTIENGIVGEEKKVLDTVDQNSEDPVGPETKKQAQKLIYRAFLGVKTESYKDFNRLLRAKLKEYEGYVETSDQQVDTVTRRGQVQELINGTYTLRVPTEKYEDFLKFVQEEAELKYKNESVQNVTAEYRDVEESVKNLEIKEETLRGFLKDAKNAEESMLIFSHLTDTRAEIDHLESRLKNLDKLVSYSTIEINVEEKEKEVDIEPIDEKLGDRIAKKFTESINELTAMAENFTVALVGNSPVYLLSLAAILIVGLILVVVIKKIIKKLDK